MFPHTNNSVAVLQFVMTQQPVDYFEYAAMHNGSDTYLIELAALTQNKFKWFILTWVYWNHNFSDRWRFIKVYFENGSITVEVKSKTIATDPVGLGTTTYNLRTLYLTQMELKDARIETVSQAKAKAIVCGIASIRSIC